MQKPSLSVSQAWRVLFDSVFPPSSRELSKLSPDVLRSAYRQQAKRTHPDRCGGDSSRFLLIVDAYQTLLDAQQSEQPKASTRPGPTPLGCLAVQRGHISRNQRDEALAWQQQNRVPVGLLAVDLGWLSPEQVEQVLSACRPNERFGDCACRLGHVSTAALNQIVREQASRQPRLGEYFVRNHWMDTTTLLRLLRDQKQIKPWTPPSVEA